jgi:hypothetical protein
VVDTEIELGPSDCQVVVLHHQVAIGDVEVQAHPVGDGPEVLELVEALLAGAGAGGRGGSNPEAGVGRPGGVAGAMS